MEIMFRVSRNTKMTRFHVVWRKIFLVNQSALATPTQLAKNLNIEQLMDGYWKFLFRHPDLIMKSVHFVKLDHDIDRKILT